MSSSVLLDNFVIQEQYQPTQSKASTYHFYKEHEQKYYEEMLTHVPSPSISTPSSQTKLKKCNCCPYGYHIDLDFIRYCEELAANGKCPSRKQLDRRNKRRQRKSLEVMLGFEDQWVLDFEKELQPPKQPRSEFDTVYEAIEEECKILPKTNIHSINWNTDEEVQHKTSSPYNNVNYNTKDEQGDFVNNILFDVYSDFERTLERTSGRSGQREKEKSSCISGEGRREPYGNEKQLETVQYTTNSSDRSPSYARKFSSNNVHQQNVSIEEVHEQIHITETTRSKPQRTHQHHDRVETDSKSLEIDIYSAEIDQLSLANRSLSDQLQSVRNQLSDNLTRVRDFEERVKKIPKLELELSVEKAENRDLYLKLKALQNALEQKEQDEIRAKADEMAEKIEVASSTTTATGTFGEHGVGKQSNARHIYATSLESLNIRFPNSFASPNESQTLHTNTSNIQPSKQNVGCMTNKILSRDVGVVTIPVLIPTRTMAINTDISAENPFDEISKKPILKNMSVQCDHDHQPRASTKSVATITDREPSPSQPPEKHSVAVLAVPNVCNNSCLARPEVRTIGVDNMYEKIRTRSFGTDPIKHLDEETSIKLIDSPISLKLLDAPKSNIAALTSTHDTSFKLPESPKEFRSIGVQQQPPNVQNKFSQCSPPPPPPSPPKVQTHTESTDTSDLTLRIHRGVNTDALLPKKHRLTNTDQIVTENKSTNTSIEKRATVDTETNTDRYEAAKDVINTEKSENASELAMLNEHQCHNCLAKIEIKKRTIIKNPNKIESSPTNISTITSTSTTTKTATETTQTTETTATTTNETINEEQSIAVQSSDLQSRIPRPTALISPRSEKKFTRQNTYTIPSSPTSSYTDFVAQCPAEAYLSSSCSGTSKATTSTVEASTTQSHSNISQTSTYPGNDIENRTSERNMVSIDSAQAGVTSTSDKTTTYQTNDDESLWGHSMKSSSTYSQLASSAKPRKKVSPSKEMQAALKVINDSLLKGQHLATTLKNANKIVQKEWFRISSTEDAQPFEVEDYLDCFEEYSPNLLKYMMNLTDANGNTAMHYAVSHGNFDVVSILLDSKVCDINATNNAGYTCVMLVSLAKLDVAEQPVVQRLFQLSDVNVRAKKHSQTALMLATSHGNYNMVRMLLDAGADINIQDEDGSTALMCAAEHGRMDIIKILLAQSDCDSTIQDLDGSTALKISLEAGYRDIGVLLYAHEYMTKNKNKSPYTSLRSGGRSRKASSSLTSSTNALHGHTSSNSNIVGTTNTSDVSNVENSKHIS